MTNWTEKTMENSEVWDKEKPIEGKLTRTESNIGPNKSMMYTIETDDGATKVWGSTVLDDKLLGVPLNTFIKIEYEGKLKSKKGAEYHSYKLFIDEDSMPDEAPNDDMPPDALGDTGDEPIDVNDIPFGE